MVSNASKISATHSTFTGPIFPDHSLNRNYILSNSQRMTWQNIRIVFCDGHTIAIRHKDKKLGKFNYSELGMVNRKNGNPTKQWNLLKKFADNHGKIDLSRSDTSSFRQQKKLLCIKLKKFLKKNEQPIVWDKYFKTYSCRFQIWLET